MEILHYELILDKIDVKNMQRKLINHAITVLYTFRNINNYKSNFFALRKNIKQRICFSRPLYIVRASYNHNLMFIFMYV